MEAGEIVVTAVGAIGGVGGAIMAWVQAKAAVGSLQHAQRAQADAEEAQKRAESARDEALELSRKATAAAERQAAAQEHANRLEEEARRPDPWSPVAHVTGLLHRTVNTAGEPLEVLGFSVLPEKAEQLVYPREIEGFPVVLEAGASFKFHVRRMNGPRAETLILQWRTLEAEDPQETRFSLI